LGRWSLTFWFSILGKNGLSKGLLWLVGDGTEKPYSQPGIWSWSIRLRAALCVWRWPATSHRLEIGGGFFSQFLGFEREWERRSVDIHTIGVSPAQFNWCQVPSSSHSLLRNSMNWRALEIYLLSLNRPERGMFLWEDVLTALRRICC
jgi:hypothetical protein